MSDLARLRIWDDPAIRDSLSWYLAVAENRRPAKFRISASLATQLDPATSSEEALWAELDRLTPIFLATWQAIRAGASLPPTADGPSLLEVCRELAYRMLAHCNFCPRNCCVDREWREDFSIRHPVMPDHVKCCTYPVLEWIAEHVSTPPVNVMAQFRPDNFCNPESNKYRVKYAEIARRPTHAELNASWQHARELD